MDKYSFLFHIILKEVNKSFSSKYHDDERLSTLIVDFVICGGGSKIKFSLKGLTALEAERRIFLFAIQISGRSGESLKSDVKSERVFLGDIIFCQSL